MHMNTQDVRIRDARAGKVAWLLCGALMGSVAVFLLDPVEGRRRRALIRDKFVGTRNDLSWYSVRKMRDLRNKMFGLRAKARNLATAEQPDDETLVNRVRSEIGRKIRHARSVKVQADRGEITLSGPILSKEVQDVIDSVKNVSGVRRVISNLDVHQTAENIPGLQGEGKEYFQELT